MATHELTASPDTVHWGYYDAALPPVLTAAPGDRLIVHTESGFMDAMERVRAAFGPKDVFNPCKILPTGRGCGQAHEAEIRRHIATLDVYA